MAFVSFTAPEMSRSTENFTEFLDPIIAELGTAFKDAYFPVLLAGRTVSRELSVALSRRMRCGLIPVGSEKIPDLQRHERSRPRAKRTGGLLSSQPASSVLGRPEPVVVGVRLSRGERLEVTAMTGISDLLTIRESPLPHRGTALDWSRSKCGRPSFGGVYVFWWRGKAEEFLGAIQNRVLHFHGPNGVALNWEITHESLRVAENELLPLYVGKNASDLAKRVGLHLKLKTPRTVVPGAVNGICERMTTSCQVRDRLDRLFPNIADTRALALDNLALSYTKIEGIGAFVERFFLEDMAIGLLRPIFNVDSER